MKGASVGGDCARGTVCRAIFRAIAKKRYFASWDRESQAGERLRLAGYSSGRGDCARGGRSAGRCGSLAGTEPGARFSRGVLRSITPAVCRLSAKQDGLRYVAFLFRRGSGSPAVRSRIVGAVIESGWFTSGLRVFWRRSRRKTRRTESAARQSAFCVNISALPCFPRGVRWGYAPQTAPKSLRLSGLSSRCGGVGLVRVRGLCALLRRRIGLAVFFAGSPLGRNVEAALRPRPQTCAKETRLPGLSSFGA